MEIMASNYSWPYNNMGFELPGSIYMRIFFGKYTVSPLYFWVLHLQIQLTADGNFHPWLVEFADAKPGIQRATGLCHFIYGT